MDITGIETLVLLSFLINFDFQTPYLPCMGGKKKVSHQFLLSDLSGEHPLRFITYAGNTESRISWVTYFATELKLFVFLEIRNMIQEQKASILSLPSPKKRTGPFHRTVDSLCTSSLASPE